jgi:hypothetical protein
MKQAVASEDKQRGTIVAITCYRCNFPDRPLLQRRLTLRQKFVSHQHCEV